jgi:hypothetical protein
VDLLNETAVIQTREFNGKICCRQVIENLKEKRQAENLLRGRF